MEGQRHIQATMSPRQLSRQKVAVCLQSGRHKQQTSRGQACRKAESRTCPALACAAPPGLLPDQQFEREHSIPAALSADTFVLHWHVLQSSSCGLDLEVACS